MAIIKLIHPTLGLCAQSIIGNSGMQAHEVIKQWKYRYGKKFYECEVVDDSKVKEKVIKEPEKLKPIKKYMYIPTGKLYESHIKAHQATGHGVWIIRQHLLNNRRAGVPLLFKAIYIDPYTGGVI